MTHVQTPGPFCVSQSSRFLNFFPGPWGRALTCGNPEACTCPFASKLCHAVHGQFIALDLVLSALSILHPHSCSLGHQRRALVVKPEAAGLGSGRRISEPSTPLAEATVRLSCSWALGRTLGDARVVTWPYSGKSGWGLTLGELEAAHSMRP